MTTELQQTRYDRLVRRVGAIIGPGSKVSEALGELFPTLDVENLPLELFSLMGTRLAHANLSQTALATFNRHAQLFNPADSGIIASITHVTVFSTTAQEIGYGRFDTEQPNVNVTGHFRDYRFEAGARSVCVQRFAAIISDQPATGIINVNGIDEVPLQGLEGLFVLAPGTGFNIVARTVNTTLLVNWFWKERPAEPSELNL